MKIISEEPRLKESKLGRVSTVTRNTYDRTLLSAISEELIELGWYRG
ncbi:NADPH-dependent 7-cyano-7-deazaguanine reductase QueF-like protein [Bacillus sp. TE9106W]